MICSWLAKIHLCFIKDSALNSLNYLARSLDELTFPDHSGVVLNTSDHPTIPRAIDTDLWDKTLWRSWYMATSLVKDTATHCLYQTPICSCSPNGCQLHGVDSNIIGERNGTPNNVQQENPVKLTPSPSLRCWPSWVTTGATTGSRPSQQRLHLRQRGESGSDPFLWPCCGWVSYMDCSRWAKSLVVR